MGRICLNRRTTSTMENRWWRCSTRHIDDADWDLVRDKPIDDYGDVEFVEED